MMLLKNIQGHDYVTTKHLKDRCRVIIIPAEQPGAFQFFTDLKGDDAWHRIPDKNDIRSRYIISQFAKFVLKEIDRKDMHPWSF